jgi:hypothetical protein
VARCQIGIRHTWNDIRTSIYYCVCGAVVRGAANKERFPICSPTIVDIQNLLKGYRIFILNHALWSRCPVPSNPYKESPGVSNIWGFDACTLLLHLHTSSARAYSTPAFKPKSIYWLGIKNQIPSKTPRYCCGLLPPFSFIKALVPATRHGLAQHAHVYTEASDHFCEGQRMLVEGRSTMSLRRRPTTSGGLDKMSCRLLSQQTLCVVGARIRDRAKHAWFARIG